MFYLFFKETLLRHLPNQTPALKKSLLQFHSRILALVLLLDAELRKWGRDFGGLTTFRWVFVCYTLALQSQNPVDQFFDLIRKNYAAIFMAIENLEPGSTAQRQQSLQKLEALLIAHLEGEEVTFYPALARSSADLTKQATIQHQDAAEVLRELMRMAPDEPDLPGQVARLKEMLQNHIKLEEKIIFKQAQNTFNDQQMQRIPVDFQVAKKYLKRVYGWE